MSNVADFFANKIIDHMLRNEAYTPATTIYVGLNTTSPGDDDSGNEVSGGSYAREAVTLTAAASRGTDNTGDEVSFTEATGSWGNVGFVKLMDALSSGNMFAWGAVDTAKDIGTGDTATIASGALSFEFTAT